MTYPAFTPMTNTAITPPMPWPPTHQKRKLMTSVPATSQPVAPDNNSTNLMIRKVEESLVAMRAQLDQFAREADVPDVFDFQPIYAQNQQSITIKIVEVQESPFYFIDDMANDGVDMASIED